MLLTLLAAAIICCVGPLVVPVVSAAAETTARHSIDGCTLLMDGDHQPATQPNSSLTTVSFFQLTINGLPIATPLWPVHDDEGSPQILFVTLQFVNCSIPRDVHLGIEALHTATLQDAAVLGDLTIEFRNTTMLEASGLKVVTAPTIRSLSIAVDHCTLMGMQDVLVIQPLDPATTAPGGDDSLSPNVVRNVSISIANSVLRSQKGSVASILPSIAASKAASVVDGASIIVGGNSTLETTVFAASVVANQVLNTNLFVDSSSCTGPVKIMGTHTSDADGTLLALLSVLAPSSSTSLSLHNTHVAVADGGRSCAFSLSQISIEAMARQGVSAAASVCVVHATRAKLHATGDVSIEFALRRSPNNSHLPMSSLPSAGVDSTDNGHTILAVVGTNSVKGVAAVGSVVVQSVHSKAAPATNVVLELKECVLRIRLEAIDNNNGLARTAMTATGGNDGSSAVLGVVVHGNIAISKLAVTDHSSLHISATTTNTASTSLTAKVRYSAVATVLGVVLQALSDATTPRGIITVSNRSSVNITLAVVVTDTAEHNKTMGQFQVEASTGRYAAASALGIATNIGSSSQSTTSVTALSVSQHSSIAIRAATASPVSTVVVDAHNSEQGNAASSALGVVMNSFAKGKTKTTIVVSQGSSLLIAVSLNCIVSGVIKFSSLSIGLSAAATLGVAVSSYSWSGTSTTTFTVAGNSTAEILANIGHRCNHADRSGGSGVSLMSEAAHYAAAAVLGVSIGANKDLKEGGTVDALVEDGSSLAVQALVLGAKLRGATTYPKETAAAVLSVVVFGDNRGTINAKGWGSSGSSTNEHPAIDIWVGATNHADIQAAGDARYSGAVALVAHHSIIAADGAESVALGFCSDGTVAPSTRHGTSVGVNPKTTTPLLSFNTTDSWSHDNASWAQHHANVSSESTAAVGWCSQKAAMLEESLCSILALPSCAASPTATLPTTSTPSLSIIQSHPVETSSRTIIEEPTLTTSRTVSLTLTSTSSQQLPQPATPPPTSPIRRTSVAVTSILLPDDETAATVVLSTAGASNALGSTLGSGGGGALVVAGSSLRMMECGLASEDPRPATFEMPIQFAIGNGNTKYFAGAAIGHTALLGVLFAAPIALRHLQQRRRRSSTPVTYLSMLFCGAYAFFTPAILGACSTVLNNDDDPFSLLAAGFSVLVITAVHLVVVGAVHRGPKNGIRARLAPNSIGQLVKLEFKLGSNTTSTSSSRSTTTDSSSSSSDDCDEYELQTLSDSSDDDATTTTTTSGSTRSRQSLNSVVSQSFLFSGSATKDILLTLFNGCRVYEKASHRHYASIETTLFSIVSIISGARPSQNCNYAAFAVFSFALMHLLYVVLIRPLRTLLDTFFAVANSLLLVTLTITVAYVLQSNSHGTSQPPHQVLLVMEVCLWSVSMLGFVQLGVQGYWAYHVAQRRLHLQQQQIERDTIEMDDPAIGHDNCDDEMSDRERPLLTVVEGTNSPSNEYGSGEDDDEEEAKRTSHNPLSVA